MDATPRSTARRRYQDRKRYTCLKFMRSDKKGRSAILTCFLSVTNLKDFTYESALDENAVN
jgi:hypothetical protein